jgi:hypothetical protein
MKDSSGNTIYFTMAEDEPQIAASAFTQVTSNAELKEIYSTYHAR